jgi:hypothetical protein
MLTFVSSSHNGLSFYKFTYWLRLSTPFKNTLKGFTVMSSFPILPDLGMSFLNSCGNSTDLFYSYCFHLSSFNRIAQKAPQWAANFCSSLYKLILWVLIDCRSYHLIIYRHHSTQSNKEFLLDVEADDLTEVDIEGLEAEAAASSDSSLPPSSPPRSSPATA